MSFAFIPRRLLRLSWPGRLPDSSELLGRRGERAAARYLSRQGYRVLARRYRCPAAEVDLVCSDGVCLILVEVKTRSDFLPTDAPAVADAEQWRRIFRAGQFFADRYRLGERRLRFDLVTVDWPARGQPAVRHFPDAYHPSRG